MGVDRSIKRMGADDLKLEFPVQYNEAVKGGECSHK